MRNMLDALLEPDTVIHCVQNTCIILCKYSCIGLNYEMEQSQQRSQIAMDKHYPK